MNNTNGFPVWIDLHLQSGVSDTIEASLGGPKELF